MVGSQLQEGTLLNERYRIIRVIGQGGMGTVYLAEHVRLDTVLAVKEILNRPGGETEEEAIARFEQEARFLVRLNHPNLPKVTDAFVDNDRLYVVMEFIEGVTLEAKMREAGYQPLDVAHLVDWALQIADVLAYLHSQTPPIIFRDLKPSNVMIQPDGAVRLIDFGIARRFQPGAVKDTALLGSVGYSPPEQFGRHQTDTRSDIYALGATLHHLLTARDPAAQPFKFPFASSLNPLVPESLSRLLQHCLAMDADQRPATIHEVARGLLEVRDEIISRNEMIQRAARDAEIAAQAESASHPRIISTKLAEAEQQRRRSNTRHVRPSGAIAARPIEGAAAAEHRSNSVVRILAMAAALVAIVAAVGFAVVKNAKTMRPLAVPHVPGNPVRPITGTELGSDSGTGQSDGQSEQSSDNHGGDGGGITGTPTVSLDAPQSHGIAFGANGVGSLSLSVHGSVQGGRGGELITVVFFTDANGNPMNARSSGSAYASRDGQLSAAKKLEVTDDPQTFDWDFQVPISEFPDAIATMGIKYHCVAFFNGANVAETPPTSLPANVLGSSTDSTPGSDAPGHESQRQPSGGGSGDNGIINTRIPTDFR